MGSGASSKQQNSKVSDAPDSGKTVSSPFPDRCTFDDESKWLTLKLEQEKIEKEWMIPRNDHQAAPSSGSSSAELREEQEVLFLRKLLETEKAEKAWMMSRIDGMDAQLKIRSDECSSLRAALGAHQACLPSADTRQAGRGTPPPEQPAVLKPAELPPQVPLATSAPQSSNSVRIPENGCPERPGVVTSTYSPSHTADTKRSGALADAKPSAPLADAKPSASLSLKERRGNHSLKVSTGKPPPLVSASPVSAVPDCASPAAGEAVLAERDTTGQPGVHKGHSSPQFNPSEMMEPMSPLLARRRGSAGKQEGRLQQMREQPSRLEKAISAPTMVLSPKSDGNLSIAAAKLSALDEAPCSPKRKRKSDFFGEEQKTVMEGVPEEV